MDFQKRDPVVVIGLLQISTVVASLLGSAAVLRLAPGVRGLPFFLRHWGLGLLALPALWVLAALYLRRRELGHPVAFRAVVLLGWVSVVVLGALLTAALVAPFLHGGIYPRQSRGSIRSCADRATRYDAFHEALTSR